MPGPILGNPCSPHTGGVKGSQTGVSEVYVLIPASNCVGLVKSFPLSEPRFLHLAYFILNKTEAQGSSELLEVTQLLGGRMVLELFLKGLFGHQSILFWTQAPLGPAPSAPAHFRQFIQ